MGAAASQAADTESAVNTMMSPWVYFLGGVVAGLSTAAIGLFILASGLLPLLRQRETHD